MRHRRKEKELLHEYQTQQDIQLDPNQIEKNLAYVPWQTHA